MNEESALFLWSLRVENKLNSPLFSAHCEGGKKKEDKV